MNQEEGYSNPVHRSYWQLGCNDAREGLPPQWDKHFPRDPFGKRLSGWQRTLLMRGYQNGYAYGMQNKKAP